MTVNIQVKIVEIIIKFSEDKETSLFNEIKLEQFNVNV